MAYVDRVMDGWVGEGGGQGSNGSNSSSSSSGSSSSSSGCSNSIVGNQHHQQQEQEQQQQQRTEQQRIRDGRERLVLLTTMGEQEIVMELNMFPYACPEVLLQYKDVVVLMIS